MVLTGQNGQRLSQASATVGRWKRRGRRPGLVATAALLALSLLGTAPAHAQTCWEYVDNNYADAPLVCVQKGGSTGACPCVSPDVCVDGSCWTPCSRNPGNNDCTSIPSDMNQTVLKMHEIWHDCFGGTGGTFRAGDRTIVLPGPRARDPQTFRRVKPQVPTAVGFGSSFSRE